MENERWYRLNYLISVFVLGVYVNLAIIWDFFIHKKTNNGEFPRTVTATLTALIHFGLLNWSRELLVKLFELPLLRNNYSYWNARHINIKNKKSLFGLKLSLFGFFIAYFVCSIFVFLVGSVLKELAQSEKYYFDKWFALAGVLIFPAVRLFTSLVYIPNFTYKLFFRV